MKTKLVLRPYQKDGSDIIFNWLYEKDNNFFILADEGGLGKSAISLDVLKRAVKHLAKTKKNLLFVVISPSGLKDNWLDEINKWLNHKKVSYTLLIETFSSCTNIQKANWLLSLSVDLMIIDEGHYLKDFKSLRTQFIYGSFEVGRQIARKAKKLLVLSATIVPNRVGEIYPLLWARKSSMIRDMTYDDFVKTWAEEWEETAYGLRHAGIVDPGKFLFNKPFFLRRTIDDVAKDIPKGFRLKINIAISPENLKQETDLIVDLLTEAGYKSFEISDLLNDDRFFELVLKTLPGFVRYTEFKKLQGLVKVKPILDIIKDTVLLEHKKIMILPIHRVVADKYFELLTAHFKKIKSSVPVIYITDNLDLTERHELLKYANKLTECVLISTAGKVREGYNLEGFRYTIFPELDWRWYLLQQCEFRTRRLGSLGHMFWIYCVFTHGLDQKIYSILDNKKQTLDKIYTGQEEVGKLHD